MIIRYNISMDMARRSNPYQIDAVQGDSNTRIVSISLYENGTAWTIPSDSSVFVRFKTSANTGGIYDTLPNGSGAAEISENVVTINLAPAIMSAPGLSDVQVAFISGDNVVASFSFNVSVQADPSVGTTRPEDYTNIQQYIGNQILAEKEAINKKVKESADNANSAMESAETAKESEQKIMEMIESFDPSSEGLLPNVSDEDNGKTVIVSGGKWQKRQIIFDPNDTRFGKNLFDGNYELLDGYGHPTGSVDVAKPLPPLDNPSEDDALYPALIYLRPNTNYAISADYYGTAVLFDHESGVQEAVLTRNLESNGEFTQGENCLIYRTGSNESGYYLSLSFWKPGGTKTQSFIFTEGTDLVAVTNPGTYLDDGINIRAKQVFGVSAETAGLVNNAISNHNTDRDAHADIRTELRSISDRLNAFFDSDDSTLDELSEIVAYIQSNKTLIDAITASKVSVSDIVDNLSTNLSDKTLSAAQGVVLKSLIDTLTSSLSGYQPKGDYALSSAIPTKTSQLQNDAGYLTEHQDISGKLDANKLPEAINTALAQAKESGEFDGADGVKGDKGDKGDTGPAGSDATVTTDSIKTALGYTPADESKKVNNFGWNANKNLGTDENGNVIEKDDIFSKDVSAWSPVEYMTGVSWKEKGYYWQADGTHTNTQYTQNYQSTTELIRIEPNCAYTLSNFAGVYFLYDSTGKNGVASSQHNDPNTPISFETTANQYYIGINHVPVGAYTADRVSLIRNTISEAEYNALPTRADSLKSLYGKKIVCFGDSLFGMYRGDDSAPAFVAAETGATVYNVGFGGCRMSVHPTSGYDAFCMWALAKAIAENDWTTQDAQASSGSSYFPEQLALLKSIDFSKVDIAVIHYGTNDFGIGTGVAIGKDSLATDYTTICGALRYSIEKLLGAYPKLRIYVSLPVYRFWTSNGVTTYSDTYTNAQGNTLKDVADALRDVAAEYNLPVIDGYYGLGINKANASTFLSDGTHHNVAGRERFGRFIGANLTGQQTSGKSGMDTAAVNALISAAIGNAIGGSY